MKKLTSNHSTPHSSNSLSLINHLINININLYSHQSSYLLLSLSHHSTYLLIYRLSLINLTLIPHQHQSSYSLLLHQSLNIYLLLTLSSNNQSLLSNSPPLVSSLSQTSLRQQASVSSIFQIYLIKLTSKQLFLIFTQ